MEVNFVKNVSIEEVLAFLNENVSGIGEIKASRTISYEYGKLFYNLDDDDGGMESVVIMCETKKGTVKGYVRYSDFDFYVFLECIADNQKVNRELAKKWARFLYRKFEGYQKELQRKFEEEMDGIKGCTTRLIKMINDSAENCRKEAIDLFNYAISK